MVKHWEDEASFGDFIISFLLSCNSRKIQRKVLFKLVQKRRRLSRRVFTTNLYRLNRKGILSFDVNKDIILHKNILKTAFLFKNINSKPKGDIKVMVLFDIPENKRKIRNWLRGQLKAWKFEMIQQSVWMGSGPLPKEFSERLELLGISKGVKVLKVQSLKN